MKRLTSFMAHVFKAFVRVLIMVAVGAAVGGIIGYFAGGLFVGAFFGALLGLWGYLRSGHAMSEPNFPKTF